MKNLFQENRNAFLLLLGLFFVLLLTAYFLFFRPLQADLKNMESREADLQEEITRLEVEKNSLEGQEVTSMEDIDKLRFGRYIPDNPDLENLILTLNEIELVTDNEIHHIGFGYEGNMPEMEDVTEKDETIDNLEESESDDSEVDEVDVDEETKESDEIKDEPVIDLSEVPDGLKMMNFTLDVSSPDYEHFQLLLQEIEKQQRVMIVTNLDFDKPAERELIFGNVENDEEEELEDEDEEADETISATINVMTFYYEG